MPSSGDEQALDRKLLWEGDRAELFLYFLQLFWAWEWRSDWPGWSDVASKHTMGLCQGWEGAHTQKRCSLGKEIFRGKNETD